MVQSLDRRGSMLAEWFALSLLLFLSVPALPPLLNADCSHCFKQESRGAGAAVCSSSWRGFRLYLLLHALPCSPSLSLTVSSIVFSTFSTCLHRLQTLQTLWFPHEFFFLCCKLGHYPHITSLSFLMSLLSSLTGLSFCLLYLFFGKEPWIKNCLICYMQEIVLFGFIYHMLKVFHSALTLSIG